MSPALGQELGPGMLGTLRPRDARKIRSSKWSIGAETQRTGTTLNYEQFRGPLGAKRARLQGGWHRCDPNRDRDVRLGLRLARRGGARHRRQRDQAVDRAQLRQPRVRRRRRRRALCGAGRVKPLRHGGGCVRLRGTPTSPTGLRFGTSCRSRRRTTNRNPSSRPPCARRAPPRTAAAALRGRRPRRSCPTAYCQAGSR